MRSTRTKIILICAVLSLFTALVPYCPAAEFIEDYVQELEVLIQNNYQGRAQTIALSRLDAILSSKDSEPTKISQLKIYRDRLLKAGAKRTAAPPPTPTGGATADLDSDGDGIEDARDNSPLVADCRDLRWELQSVNLAVQLKRDDEQVKQAFVFAEFPMEDSDNALGIHPLRLLNIRQTDEARKARLKLASRSSIPWGAKNQQTARKCSDQLIRALAAGYSASAIVSFDVAFFNDSSERDFGIQVEDAVPLLIKGKTIIKGRCVEGDKVIRLPKKTHQGQVVRFISRVADETLLSLVVALKDRSPSVALESSGIKVIDKAIGDLIAIARNVRRRTYAVTFRTNYGSISWRVARRRNRDRPSLAESLDALNKHTRAAVGVAITTIDEHGITSIGGLANSDNVRWVVMAEHRVVPDVARALKLPMSGNIEFVLVLRKALRRDLDAYRAVLLRGIDTATYLRTRVAARLEEWKIGHSLGWSEATFLMARCCEEGIGVARDYKKSLKLHGAAAEAGLVLAMNRLGEIYGDGQGVNMDDKKAVAWFSRAAELGDPVAQDNLGRRYYYGLGIEQDNAKALEWFRKAAESNYVYALNSLGTMNLNGVGTAKDETKALDWFKRAAQLQFAPAMLQLGNLYRQGTGVKADAKQAIAWYAKAAEHNNLDALNQVAEMYEWGEGVPVDLDKASKFYRQAAEQGNARAQSNLGRLYEQGRGVKQELRTAMEWYIRAAEQNDPQALTKIGQLYTSGTNVKRDYVKAVRFLKQAAAAGYAPAQTQLGIMHMRGWGVEADNAEAIRWLEKATKNGDAEAFARLGQIYERQQDYKKAVKSYTDAANRGNTKGKTYLGRAYRFGVGVPKDAAKAAQWYSQAAKAGDSEAKYNLGLLYEEGSGVEKNLPKSLELITEAANEGWSLAQYYLGTIYHRGRGVKQDIAIARTLYEKAAAQGEIAAKLKLGEMFERGDGVAQSLAQARKWYGEAAEGGSEEATRALKRLRRK